MPSNLKPFSCVYSPQIPELLYDLRCSIVVSTYQANKLIFISPKKDGTLVQLVRNFDKVMGFQFSGSQLALSTRNKIHMFSNSPELAASYPKQKLTYDALFAPRKTFFTGQVDIHDIHIEDDEVYGVNTSFSTIVKTSSVYNWEPIWTPPHIDKLVSEDRAHLNGFTFIDGQLKYATALGNGNTKQEWRNNIPNGGVLWDTVKNKVIHDNLQMPHSPRLHKGNLYFLESASGNINTMNIGTNEITLFKNLSTFVRGLAFHGNYMFVGRSKIRKNSSIFKNLEIAQKDVNSGITIIHMPSCAIVGNIDYLSSVDEIYDVQILPDFLRPNILNPEDDFHNASLAIPTATFWGKTALKNN